MEIAFIYVILFSPLPFSIVLSPFKVKYLHASWKIIDSFPSREFYHSTFPFIALTRRK